MGEQRDLEFKLRSYAKDKLALKNLRFHHKHLEERSTEAKTEYRATEERYRKVEKERDDLFRRYQKALQEIQRKAELGKNIVLEKKLEHLTMQYDEKQTQVHQSTKAFNDTILVYEVKLPSLGIEPEEIGFEAIQTATSVMPARLVTKVA